MDLLREILRIVSSKSNRSNLDLLLREDGDSSTLSSRFLQGLVSGTYNTDTEAAADLYCAGAKDPRYRTLKSRTFERLTISVLHLNIRQPEHSEYLSSYYKCIRYEVAAQTLMRFASRRAGYFVALKTLSIAQRYHISSVCLSLSALLRDSAALWGNQSDFYHYSERVRYYSKALVAEYESDFLLDDLRLELQVTHYDRSYYSNKHKSILDSITSMCESHPTHSLVLNKYRASIDYYETIEDFEEVRVQCDDAINYLNCNPHLTQPARTGEFLLRRVAADIYSRRPITDNVIAECSTLFVDGGPNWHATMILLFVSKMNDMKILQAIDVFRTVSTMGNFEGLHGLMKERWLIHSSYLMLARELEIVESSDYYSEGFRLSTFLNSLTNESKSKRGANSLIVIFHAFYLLVTNKFDLAEKRIEYLNVYCTRYLRDRQHTRVRVFIKALQQIPRYRGDVAGLRLALNPYLKEIKSAASIPMPGEVNELLPYDVILEAYVRKLEKEASARH